MKGKWIVVATLAALCLSMADCKRTSRSTEESSALEESQSQDDGLSMTDCADKDTITHGIDEYVALIYDYEMTNAQSWETLLNRMMFSLWAKDSITDFGEYYWNWGKEVTDVIDSLATKSELNLDNSVTRYTVAMDSLLRYLGNSTAEAQIFMNGYSYIEGVANMFLLMRVTADVAERFPQAEIRKEWDLFNQYQSSLEELYYRADDAFNGNYSMKSLVRNNEASERFQARANTMRQLLRAADGTPIKLQGTPVSDQKLRSKFRGMLPGVLRPAKDEASQPQITDTIATRFFRWIRFRDTVARQLPPTIAPSYRNQTQNERLRTVAAIDSFTHYYAPEP